MCNSRTVLLHAVGDIALGDHPLCAGFGVHSRSRREIPTFPFAHVKQLLATADLRFGNLECTLSKQGRRPSDYHSVQMRGHEEYVAGLTETGFDVLNVANNHSMQHGVEPFTHTVALLNASGIRVCGVAGQSGSQPATLTVKGLRITFLGYSLRPRQYFTRPPLYAEGLPEGISADVRTARSSSDIVVVSLHWGDEFIERPAPTDVRLARSIIDAGADLILGHHPHVLRGLEQHGRGWIVYSLGNFVCDMLWGEELRETAICECSLTVDGVRSVRLIPARINDDYQPVPLSGEAARRLGQRLASLDAAIGQSDAADSMAQSEYESAAQRTLLAQRARSHRYFLKNAYRFPPGILTAQLTTYVRNRLLEHGWRARLPKTPD